MSYNKTNPRPIISNIHNFNSNYSQKQRVSLSFPSDSPYTKQEFRDECDINVLMSKYQSSGELPVINQTAPQYLDATGFDYQMHMQFIAGANSLFQELPSEIRNRFSNDPAQFLDFTSNENNRAEMHEMGLLKPQSEWVSLPPSQNNQTSPAASQVPSTLSSTPAPSQGNITLIN